MFDLDNVTLVGMCTFCKKAPQASFDYINFTIESKDFGKIRVKSSGDKDKFFSEDDYKNAQMYIENAKIELESYTNKKTGEQVKNYVLKARPSYIKILQGPTNDFSFCKMAGKVVHVDGNIAVIESKYFGGMGQNKQLKERHFRVQLPEGARVDLNKAYSFFGQVGSDDLGIIVNVRHYINTYYFSDRA